MRQSFERVANCAINPGNESIEKKIRKLKKQKTQCRPPKPDMQMQQDKGKGAMWLCDNEYEQASRCVEAETRKEGGNLCNGLGRS